MKSPFPGMDPYIEGCGLFADFHNHLIEDICKNLADGVPENYTVRSGTRAYLVLVESKGEVSRPFQPDVRILASRKSKTARRSSGTALLEPPLRMKPVLLKPMIEEEHREAFVEIFEATPKQRLVTSIEVLSPSNKRPGSVGWEQYQRKRQSCLLEGVNLVEIDLLRGGSRMPASDPWPACAHSVLVARAKSAFWQVWPISLAQSIPFFPVPLAKPDPDVHLDLQPLIDTIYQRYHYERNIDYARSLDPPLSAEEATWLKNRLHSRKR